MQTFFRTLLSLAALSLTSLHAQTSSMRTNVPFDFHVAGRVLHAGSYRVEIDKRSYTAVISSSTESVNVVFAASPAIRNERAAANGALLFQNYGAAHFLKRIWLSGEVKGYVLPETKGEHELARSFQASSTFAEIASR
jgi:hypothetical protein